MVTNSSIQDSNQGGEAVQEDSPLCEAFIACLESEAYVFGVHVKATVR